MKTRSGAKGEIDFGGPFVKGKRGARFLYLSWGTLDADEAFTLFRAAKLWLSGVDPAVVHEAMQPGHCLVGLVGLTDRKGQPLCASVRPPTIVWSAEEA